MTQKPASEELRDVIARTDRLRQLSRTLETAMEDGARQRKLLAQLRREADALRKIFDPPHR